MNARAHRRKRWLSIGLGLIAGLAALAFSAPYVSVAVGARRSTACLDRYRSARAPGERPDCGGEMSWFVTPSRLAWTRDAASYRGEELYARIAISTYIDAAVGAPDRPTLTQAAAGLSAAEKVVKDGSQRVSMEDLGLSVGSPNLGRTAVLVGDRATLVGRADEWSDWHVRLHALRAALLEGDPPLALRLAKRYAEFDPRDDDLRATVAALLCLGEDPKRGLDLLPLLQDDRASRRYAAMARDWGDVRLLIVACASRAGVVPPPRPEAPEAGQGDELEPRAALRLRLMAPAEDEAEPSGATSPSKDAAGSGSDAKNPPGAPLRPPADRDEDAVMWAAEILAMGVRDPRARPALLALIAASRFPPSAAQVVELLSKAGDEPPLERPEAMTALDWLHEARGLRPIAPAPTIKLAAERIGEMAAAPGLDAASASALRAASSSLWIEAGKASALAGETDAALAAIDRGGADAQWPKPAIALARSSVRLLGGDPAAALAELDALGLSINPPSSNGSGQGGADAPGGPAQRDADVLAALLVQRTELLAMLRPPGIAPLDAPSKKLLADAALSADLAASTASDARLDARARWLRLAFVRTPDGSPLRPGTEVDAARLIPPRAWPWIGDIPSGSRPAGSVAPPLPAGESSLDRRWEGPLARSLSVWKSAVAAPAPQRLELRYALLSARGDAPLAPLAHLSLATELLGGLGGVEVWLDVVMAQATRSMSYRSYAFARWQAARARGDKDEAAAWWRRFEALRAITSDPARAEIAAFLGI